MDTKNQQLSRTPQVVDEGPVTFVRELEMSKWLFGSQPAAWLLYSILEIRPDVSVLYRVREPIITVEKSTPGDVDALFAQVGDFAHSTAIELKRITVSSSAFFTVRPGKLREIQKGIRQANGLHALGFHKSYLLLCVQIDGRDRQSLNFFGRTQLTNDLQQAIDGCVDWSTLNASVGLAFVHVGQSLEKGIAYSGGISPRVVRKARRQRQSGDLTERVAAAYELAAAEKHPETDTRPTPNISPNQRNSRFRRAIPI